LSRKHILTYVGYSVKLRSVFVPKRVIFEQVSEGKYAQLFVEPLGLLRANASEGFYFGFKKGRHGTKIGI
jgi:hypothetical protein